MQHMFSKMSLTNKYLPIVLSTLFLTLFSFLHIKSLALSLATTTSSLSLSSSVVASNETDFHALLAIKSNILPEHRHALRSWNESLHFCEWQGVKCGRRHKRVTSIDLMSQDLVGSLSPYIGNLSFLRVLRLSNNTFLGEIPTELGNLFRLQVLYLHNNSFGGKFPSSISHCSNLTILSVGFNKLVGEFPQQLFHSLSKLVYLAIHYNNLTGGVHPSIVNLTSLEKLSAPGNPLGGSIPNSLGQLKNLSFLGLGRAQISGIIPPSIYNLSLLTSFSVSENKLDGILPPSFGFLFPNLQFLQLGRNRFTGPLPLSLSNCSQLIMLDIGDCNFSGKLKIDFGNQQALALFSLSGNNLESGEFDELAFLDSLTNCSNLRVMDMAENQFRGILPNSIGNLSTNLSFFSLGGNQIHGTIPSTIINLVSLTTLFMDANRFTGRIPHTIGYLHKLQSLAFDNNNLLGKIPDSIGNLSSLNYLYLAENSLEGTIPSSLGDCQNLLILRLSGNNLTGNIPIKVFTVSSLSISLDLARNGLSGSLPVEVENLKNLAEIDVSENRLSGEIPSTLGSCHSLENLFLQQNFFGGSIPNSLESLRGSQTIDLSHNKLSGQIPTFLGTFSLKKLNLSFNDFVGEVPMKGVFTNLSAISVVGNNRLCGGISELRLSHCTTKRANSKMPLSHKLAITIPTSLVGVILLSSSIICWFKRKRITTKPTADSLLKEPFLKVTYGELLKATNGFSSSNLLGFGRFGSVYRGILDQDGEFVVAVKVLNLQIHGATKSFIAECEALRTIRHRNLVRVITSCSSVDFQGNDFKALIYEFMPNGSLENWLHPNPETSNGQNEFQGLNLVQRINIAIDVASAIDYLHNQCHWPIVHCDLKPSNILIDRDMIAHVGDFGLAKFYTEIHTPIPNTSSSGVRGTIGYAAPEYGMGSKMSSNGDIYSYGILLLEMITGKRPTDSSLEASGHNLHNFVRLALPQRMMEIVDPLLLRSEEQQVESNQITNDHQSGIVEDCLIPMLNIGLACSTDSPQHRLSTSDVIHQLCRVKNKILQG